MWNKRFYQSHFKLIFCVWFNNIIMKSMQYRIKRFAPSCKFPQASCDILPPWPKVHPYWEHLHISASAMGWDVIWNRVLINDLSQVQDRPGVAHFGQITIPKPWCLAVEVNVRLRIFRADTHILGDIWQYCRDLIAIGTIMKL